MIAGIFIELIIVRIDNISRFHGYSLTRFGFSVILVGTFDIGDLNFLHFRYFAKYISNDKV